MNECKTCTAVLTYIYIQEILFIFASVNELTVCSFIPFVTTCSTRLRLELCGIYINYIIIESVTSLLTCKNDDYNKTYYCIGVNVGQVILSTCIHQPKDTN